MRRSIDPWTPASINQIASGNCAASIEIYLDSNSSVFSCETYCLLQLELSHLAGYCGSRVLDSHRAPAGISTCLRETVEPSSFHSRGNGNAGMRDEIPIYITPFRANPSIFSRTFAPFDLIQRATTLLLHTRTHYPRSSNSSGTQITSIALEASAV